jgi:alginate O-acetyltransferase complex protein AlgI
VWLFAANLVFYAWGEPIYVLLMLATVVINYIAGILVGKYLSVDRPKARLVVIVNCIVNLAILVFFKYSDLFLSLFKLPGLGLALPIGISFYTFQNISYPIDLYRGETAAQRSFIKFGTYVSLFPQLIAGPIVRYKDIGAQLSNRRETTSSFVSGIRRFTVGLCKKVLLANNIGQLWELSLNNPDISAAGAWLGIAAFSFQLYFDFSGYSDMAIGLGRMLGFEFLENFNYPYISKSITEFWRRWHISLGSWFRDYVYIPLGGNRKGFSRQLLNITIVWSLTGFWHGASWNFLLWGIYYALWLVIEKAVLLKLFEKLPALIRHVYTLVIVVFGWVLFAVEDFGSLTAYLSALFGSNGGVDGNALYYLRNYAAVIIICALASTPVAKVFGKRLEKFAPILTVLALLLCTAYLVNSTYNPFLYLRF